tara:strand:- start:404 stop:1390 length:987 start_codon:yes stop_codon:yes gene_type:complete
MVLPLIGGMLGAGLAGAGMMGLGGMSPLLAGALGSGLGSLAQGDDFGEAIATGLGSYFGGKFLGPMLGKAGIGMNPSTAVTMSQGVPAFELGSAVASPSLLSSALSSNAIGSGAAGLLSRELTKSPEEFKSEIKKSNIPQAEPANRMAKFPSANYMPGFDPEFNYFRNFKGGGIADLMEMQEGGEMAGEPNDKEIIADAVEAIKGIEPNPEAALARFVSKYGEEALRELVDKVMAGEFDANSGITEGMLNGVGDGMDDMIPANLEGEQDVVLSDGEFIVPADVVSGIGNGSSDAGSEALYDMMDRVRMMRTGTKKQPDQVPLERMMPA